MTSFQKLGVAADHIAKHAGMRQEVLKVYPDAKFNESANASARPN